MLARLRTLRPYAPHAAIALTAIAIAWAFAATTLMHTRPMGLPLDDSYIYLTYAKQFGRFQPFSYFPGGGTATAVGYPKPGSTINPTTPITLSFSKPVSKVLGSHRPTVTPATSGTWKQISSHRIQFVPSGYGYGLDAHVQITMPSGVRLVGGQSDTATSVKCRFGDAASHEYENPVVGSGPEATGTAAPPLGATIAFARKIAISARVTFGAGQKSAGAQPVVTPRAAMRCEPSAIRPRTSGGGLLGGRYLGDRH